MSRAKRTDEAGARSKRALDQFTNYDKKLISVLEILGAHFTDIYFNHVYNAAKTRIRKNKSITDEYIAHVRTIVHGIKVDDKCYNDTVTSLHKFFQKTTRFATLSFPDFVDRVVSKFVPEEYYKILQNNEKDQILCTIIVDLVAALGVYVTRTEMLRKVIDEHDTKFRTTIRMIQDESVHILLRNRDEIMNSFLRRLGQTKTTVSIDIVEDMKKVIRKLAKEKAEILAQSNRQKLEIDELEMQVKDLKTREKKFAKIIQLLKSQIAHGKEKAAIRAAASRAPPRETLAEKKPRDDPLSALVQPREKPPSAGKDKHAGKEKQAGKDKQPEKENFPGEGKISGSGDEGSSSGEGNSSGEGSSSDEGNPFGEGGDGDESSYDERKTFGSGERRRRMNLSALPGE